MFGSTEVERFDETARTASCFFLPVSSAPVHEHTAMTEHKKSLQALFVLQTFLISLMRDPVLTFYAHNTTHA